MAISVFSTLVCRPAAHLSSIRKVRLVDSFRMLLAKYEPRSADFEPLDREDGIAQPDSVIFLEMKYELGS